jgi:hypothetical protein
MKYYYLKQFDILTYKLCNCYTDNVNITKRAVTVLWSLWTPNMLD